MALTITNLLIIALGLVIIGLAVWVWQLERRLARLFTGRAGQNLEELAIHFGHDLDALDRSRQEIERFLIKADERLKNSVRHVQTFRYNPFPDQGGNQSFTTALLNEKGDGVIITGLHARDTMRVYAKPIVNRTSQFELTTEEQACLADKQTIK
jgi:predicted phosphohydrolase